MFHLHCTRCGLGIKIQASYLRIDNCPRCLARSATVAPLAFRDDSRPLRAPRPQRLLRGPGEGLAAAAEEGAEL
jgi:hypothetical protein